MTREEAEKYADNMTYRDAINNLTKARSIPHRKATFIKINELLKALEREPCDDCISRQSVLEIFGYVMDYWKEHAIDVEPHEIKDALIEQYEFTAKQLSELPSVTPQPKTGRWINGNPICPCCGENKFKDLDADIWADWQPNYCPNCGAKMVEPQGSEE